MSFSQAAVVSVNPPTYSGGDLLISWVGSLPPGQVFQVYLDRSLAYSGTQARCRVPWPPRPVSIDIGAVDAADARTSFAASLAAAPDTRAYLTWKGGTFQGDTSGFHVYGEATPGGGIDFSAPIATIPAYVGGVVTDGWGLGGWGGGGFGQAPGSYSWKSAPLSSGAWRFCVASFDAAGNLGARSFCVVNIQAPPAPPALYPGTFARLECVVNGFGRTPWGLGGFGAPSVTLNWNPSPG